MRPLVFALSALLFASSAGAFPMFGGGGPLTATANVASPRSIRSVAFRFHAEGPVRGGLSNDGHDLVFGTMAGSLVAIDSRTGAKRWRLATNSPISGTPAIAGSLVIAANQRELFAVDRVSGRKTWSLSFGASVDPSHYWEFYGPTPNVVGAIAYVGSDDGHLRAVAAATGRAIWEHNEASPIRGAAAVADGLVVFGTLRGEVVALDRASGKVRWRFKTDGFDRAFEVKHNDTRSVVIAPAIADHIVLAGGRDGMEYAIDARSGALRWKTTHDGGSWILSLAARDGVAISGSGSASIVHSADLQTGKEIWRSKVPTAMFGAVTIAGDTIVAPTLKGPIVGIDFATGKRLWSLSVPTRLFSTPAIGDDRLYVADDEGNVTAFVTARGPALDRPQLLYAELDTDLVFSAQSASLANREAFEGSGYSVIRPDDLVRAIAPTIAGKERAILVLGERILPKAVDAALLRKFVSSGGHLVLTSANPLGYALDAHGDITDIDDEGAAKALGITPIPLAQSRGYQLSRWTSLGATLGLEGTFTTTGPAAQAGQVDALATDEYGAITAWTKRVGQGRITSLPFPRLSPAVDSDLVNAITMLSAMD